MEHAGTVVPVGEHALARPAVAHDVVQADRLQRFQRLPFGRRDVGLADIRAGVEDVLVGGRDVHVAQDDGVGRVGGRRLAQRLQPRELVRVVVGAGLAAVGHVDADHAHAVAGRGDRPRLGAREAGRAGQAGRDVLEAALGEDRDAVPGRLPVHRDLIAARRQLVLQQPGERLVGQLGLLQAQDVRLTLVQPGKKTRHALLDGVHVPGDDAHAHDPSDVKIDVVRRFDSLYSHGFARIAAAVPHVRPAEPVFNAERTLELARRASEQGAAVVAFPALGLSAYAIDDLLHQQAVQDAVVDAIDTLAAASRDLFSLLVVGAPLRAEGGLFNCGVVIHRGEVLGVIPKSYLPEYREYYEERQFRAARELVHETIELGGRLVPAGNDLLFAARDLPGLAVHVEICEDVWTPLPPSTFGALAGASVMVNLSASNITIGKADYRRTLCASHSARLIGAYVYTAAGASESTTDLAWDGQCLIAENGELLTEADRFANNEQLIYGDVDLDRIASDRASTNSFGDTIHDHRERLQSFRRGGVEVGVGGGAPAVGPRRGGVPHRPA